jgi:hypothetical protein
VDVSSKSLPTHINSERKSAVEIPQEKVVTVFATELTQSTGEIYLSPQ